MNYAILPVDALRREHRHGGSRQVELRRRRRATRSTRRCLSPRAATERRAARGHSLRRRRASSCARRCSTIPRWSAARSAIALPVSDTVDLYLKGLIVEPETVTVAGTATPSAASGEITVQLDREATGAHSRRSVGRACARRPAACRATRRVRPQLPMRKTREVDGLTEPRRGGGRRSARAALEAGACQRRRRS